MKGYYRHKKGNIYRVLYEAKHSETGEALVVYQAMYGKGEIWVRPKDMFFEEGRFERISDDEAQNLIPIELNSKYRFPDIEYTPIKVPLIDAGTFSKNVKAMITLLGKKGIVREELFNELNIKNDDDLEDYINAENGFAVIEWPYQVIQLLPNKHVEIKLTFINDDKREIEVSSHNVTDEWEANI